MLKKSLLLFSVCAVVISAATPYNVSTYTYKTVGDVQILLDVSTPPSPAPKAGYPVFFAIPGGGYVAGGKSDIFEENQLAEVTKRGWAIVAIDYRLLPGVFLEDVVEDIQDAYAWMRNELPKRTPINPNMVTVFGQSAGGGLAAISGYKFQPRPKAIIGFYSGRPNWIDPNTYDPSTPVDLVLVEAVKRMSKPVITEYSLDLKNNPRLDLYAAIKKNGKFGWMAVTHDPNYPVEEIMKKLRALSAAENVDEDYPPTYLAHGLADTVVPSSQSVQMAKSLEKKKIPYVLDLIPGAGHGFDSDESLFEKHVLPAFDFAEKYMKCGEIREASSPMRFLEK